jgi:hypothetical protein
MKGREIIRTGIRKTLSILFVAFISPIFLFSQNNTSIKSSLDRNQVLLGEQVQLSVEIKTPAARPVTKWYDLPDSFHHLEVLSRSQIDSTEEAGIRTYRQSFVLTGFDSGQWVIPRFTVSISKKTYKSDSLFLGVLPVQLLDSSYHDIREIIIVPDKKISWWYWLAGVLSLVILGLLVYLWLKSFRKSAARAGGASAITPLEEALAALEQLHSESLPRRGAFKTYYSRLSDIFKKFLSRRFQTPAMQSTTGELLILLADKMGNETLSKLAETLRIADAVKFAKYQPAHTQAEEAFEMIKSTIRILDSQKL